MFDLFKTTFGKVKMREHGLVDEDDNLVEASLEHAITQADDGWYLRFFVDSRIQEFVDDGWVVVDSKDTPWVS